MNNQRQGQEDRIQDLRNRIGTVFDPELVERFGCELSRLLASHLEGAYSGGVPVLPWVPPSENCQAADATLNESEQEEVPLIERFERLVRQALERGHRLHHPHYIGHQVPPPVPTAAWFDVLGAMTNQVMAVYEMGPWGVAVEKSLVRRLGRMIGWAEGSFDGVITHGGTLANLTALLTARNVALGESWTRGVSEDGSNPIILVHQDVHYGVTRAAGILGLGTDAVEAVPLDDRRRMDPAALEKKLVSSRAAGRTVIAVVACACATPIGAFDPLDAIADVCQQFNVWLHVDAAHGGSVLMCDAYRSLVSGIHRADSVVWDAHKMLYVPGLCAFVFYQNKEHAMRTFHQDAQYIFDPTSPELDAYNIGMKTVECTKRAAGFGLWGLWGLYGESLFSDLVELSFSMGKQFYQLLDKAADFLPLHEPQCNIVVFRYQPSALQDVSEEVCGRFQLRLRRRLVESGEFYLVSTVLNGAGALRVTIINPLTTIGHLGQLLDSIREEGHAMLAEGDLG